jgi:hypothetical protein
VNANPLLYDKNNPELSKTVPFKSWKRRTAVDILNTDYPPIQYVVPGVIPEGLTKIDGGPKVGKSWLALHLASAVSSGGVFMGSIPVEQREVLYLALEDSERRIKSRLLKQMGTGNERFFVETAASWKGGLSTLTAYLKEYPETGLVIIDTLFMFSPIADTNKYSDTYSPVSAIQRIATEKEVPVLLIHHTRKGMKGDTSEGWADEGMGSQGINGACDTIILLKKPDGKDEGTMRIKGRDIEEKCLNVIFDKDICTWRITGEGEIGKTDPKAQQELIALLEKAGKEGMKTGDIAEALGKTGPAISNLLKILEGKNRVINVSYGKYILSQFNEVSRMNVSESVNIDKAATFTDSHLPRQAESVKVNKSELSQIHMPLGRSESVNVDSVQTELDIW